jgi:aminoglycoside phosphotransferase (APT) family kinase protein
MTPPPPPPPQDDRATTWPALLAHWLAFAQASSAFPRNPQGDRLRAAVPSIINLQAVTFALAELHLLPTADRAPAIDKAAHLIDQHAKLLTNLFAEAPNEEIATLINDARAVLQAVRS